MSGWILLAIGLVIALVDLAVGFGFIRRGSGRAAANGQGMPLDAAGLARIGRLIVFMSPLLLLIFAALAFGWIPASGIDPIRFN